MENSFLVLGLAGIWQSPIQDYCRMTRRLSCQKVLRSLKYFTEDKSGWGRDRTVDLTIFSRTLVPTELPSREINRDPDGT